MKKIHKMERNEYSEHSFEGEWIICDPQEFLEEPEFSINWMKVTCKRCLVRKEMKTKLTLSQWFFKMNNGTTTWTEYKRMYAKDETSTPIPPNHIKSIWNAGARSGKVQK